MVVCPRGSFMVEPLSVEGSSVVTATVTYGIGLILMVFGGFLSAIGTYLVGVPIILMGLGLIKVGRDAAGPKQISLTDEGFVHMAGDKMKGEISTANIAKISFFYGQHGHHVTFHGKGQKRYTFSPDALLPQTEVVRLIDSLLVFINENSIPMNGLKSAFWFNRSNVVKPGKYANVNCPKCQTPIEVDLSVKKKRLSCITCHFEVADEW